MTSNDEAKYYFALADEYNYNNILNWVRTVPSIFGTANQMEGKSRITVTHCKKIMCKI